MKQNRSILTLNSLLLLLTISLTAFTTKSFAQSEVTGFFDLLSTQNLTTKSGHEFNINQFEIDVSYAHQTNFSVGTAVAFNPDLAQMELA
ncbi:MAG: hypothetical protein KAI45_05490, partial [Melioribacteraceae bacterium]|nr:hypothetical protein [Melioribacteraceae bacterium]